MLRIIDEEGTTSKVWESFSRELVRPYIVRQLCRRGVRRWARLEEAIDVALQNWAVLDRSAAGSGGLDAWRPRADRAVYRTLRELRPIGRFLDERGGPIPARGSSRHEEAAEPIQVLIDRIEALPTDRRLVVKLKAADALLPGLLEGRPAWRADEAAFLLARHPGATLESLAAEVSARLEGRRLYAGKVPAPVIAWLIGRAGSNAVDKAYEEIKRELRRSFGDSFPTSAGSSDPDDPLSLASIARAA